ncbi:E3 SUMO-protein ligase gei-17 [Escovopsis weberi]|uniref:E3 SUMO-protein ligase gei-17 n=1 Tax=Escovopsis weberi TaxID=150374 RepID=A0A0N0RTN2_ESCWE|nr:E3 SUMO-protein ligase gei-17 [Escovopsis weberi]
MCFMCMSIQAVSMTLHPCKPACIWLTGFVDSFAVGPEQILPQMKIIKLQFELSTKEATNIPKVVVPNELQQDLHNELPTTLSGPSWAVSRTCWPSHIHVIFNQQPQILRRKQHFHHDQPVELTELVVPGSNEVDISFPVYPQNSQPNANDFVAVERISTIDHETVWSLVHSHEHTTTEETKSVIKKRLNASESDDIVVENDSLRVSIVDPFSSQMYVVPVRGVECKHLECIDLQNWLETRPRKFATEPTEPTVVDCWSCPICGLDARPTSLRIDDFFAEVRQKLLESGNGSAKAIEVAADGSWKAVQEVISDPSSHLAKRDIKRISSRGSAGLSAWVPETIEILDDDDD